MKKKDVFCCDCKHYRTNYRKDNPNVPTFDRECFMRVVHLKTIDKSYLSPKHTREQYRTVDPIIENKNNDCKHYSLYQQSKEK